MPQVSFGPAAMWAERVDVIGSGIGPRQFGILDSVSISFAHTVKELYGQGQYPAVVTRGQGKITGKAKLARINMRLYSDIFFGLTPSTGQLGVSQDENATVPASPTYTVTVANSATYLDDLGVWYGPGASAGDVFNRVTTPTNAGEYSVNLTTGVYTFAAPDASLPVRISYKYNVTTPGLKLSITNQAQGFTPAWKCTVYNKTSPSCPTAGTQALPIALQLNACVSTTLTFPFAQDSFSQQDFDFSAFADCSDIIGILSVLKQ
jgi:hypothetical protein